MRTTFKARAAGVERDVALNAEYLVLAEGPEGGGKRLEVQRAIVPGDQDKALGQDTYCLVTEQGVTHYGGVEAWQISGTTLKLGLSEDAAASLGSSEFWIELPRDDRKKIAVALSTLLA